LLQKVEIRIFIEAMAFLPIDSILPDLLDTLQKTPSVLLSAPPGAGKTTRVPVALTTENWLKHEKLILLEPRRLAARRAAEYMSAQLQEEVGQSVGYRIRGESRVSSRTRIEVVTEGILTRILQDDPTLPGVSCIVFDEFHERTIHADLGLALALDVQKQLRRDLRIVVMSATMDGLRIAEVLDDAPLVRSEGQSYPVRTEYLGSAPAGPIEKVVAEKILQVLEKEEGDILVFLPGQREIHRVKALLEDREMPPCIITHELFGDAGYRQQQAAITPAPKGKRKVILSTSIAETSLTIDGVRVVIDSGLSRMARFDPRRGMTGLVTVPVSRATADQRRGRAGRQTTGSCYRLWTERQQADLREYPQPEILTADLAPLALELARWGDPEGIALRFIDRPPAPHLLQARNLLTRLGALDAKGHITAHGRQLASLPTHPRLANMIIRGGELGMAETACDLAALLEERDISSEPNAEGIDLTSRWHMLQTGQGADRATRTRIQAQARRLKDILHLRDRMTDDHSLGVLLALAYPERIAKRREGSRYQMAGGTGAIVPPSSPLIREKFLAIGEVDGTGNEVRVFLACRISQEDLERVFTDHLVQTNEVIWSQENESVVARKIKRLGALTLAEGVTRPEGAAAISAMTEGIRQMGLGTLPWTKAARALQARSEWLRTHSLVPEGWPNLSDDVLLTTLGKWLTPFLGGIWQRSQLHHLDLAAILLATFTRSQITMLDRLAPAHISLPSGSRVAPEYENLETPILAVKLQELLGQVDTPTIGGKHIALVIHLLSPAGRPLAVTQDLKSFWQNVYPKIRTQMQARYPKHYWPEDPLRAKPTSRTVKQMKRNRTRKT
jgi:ATP-dependent helicase HrpB